VDGADEMMSWSLTTVFTGRVHIIRLAGGISVICAEKCQAGVRVRNENAQREENGDFATNRRSLTRAANLKWANLLSGIF
jgi:hypothetical protein